MLAILTARLRFLVDFEGDFGGLVGLSTDLGRSIQAFVGGIWWISRDSFILNPLILVT